MTGRQIKICGLSTPDTLNTAIKCGADYIGLVFYEPSPRNVSISLAARLADQARGKTRIVALTVDADDKLIKLINDQVRPDFFQMHGSETPQRIAQIKQLTKKPAIKAIKVKDASDLAEVDHYLDCADIILFDAKAPKGSLPGGNAISFDWSILADIKRPEKFMLAGGVDAANVTEAISVTNAAIIDASSAVETRPGQKDAALIKKFIEAFRTAG